MLIATILVIIFFRPLPQLAFWIGLAAGSLLPDSDIFGSPASFICPLWIFFKHRKHIHSMLAALIFTSLACIINFQFGLGVGWGFTLHLLADNFTPAKCKYLFYPFNKK
ncbi:MAG TPA: metal-dependent hydrolase [Patescibacteria group bacterium]|nr:metal-dependent hydrolase [Patescibacteria group bacterium]